MIYSRNLENLSPMYPDVIDNVKELTPPDVKNFIIDSELVAYDKNLEKILPF
jgi:DNA ligase-1